jgi:hypothetical protein
MTRYFMVTAQQQVMTQADAATYAQIQGALDTALSFQDNSCGVTIGGSWVGPPRVTRQASISIANDRITRFAALFSFPDSPVTDDTARQCILNLVNLQLPFLNPAGTFSLSTNWSNAAITEYNPGSNGSVDWWASGQAANTHTKDAFDLNQQTGHTSTIENPNGPTVLTPGDLQSPLPNITSSGLMTTVYVVGGAIALYFLWPVLSGARTAASNASRGYQMRSRQRARTGR